MAEHSYPYQYDRTSNSSFLRERYLALAPGTDSGDKVRVAGRIVTIRSHGKAAFADLKDASGTIQLFAQHVVLGDDGMEHFSDLSVGDIVGAEGEVVMTKRGELSVRVVEVTVLAECRRPMPEKWHGMTDVEARYRQRYLDLLSNPDARRAVDARAAANTAVRRFLGERGFIEVETPLLQPVAGGAVARPFITHHNALDIDLYLRIAPELYLKRLLIGGLERVYELNRSFRNEGVSARHNPEFTMLEAYEAYVDYEHTMALVEALVRAIAEAVRSERDLGPPWRRITMFDAISEATGRDLHDIWAGRDWDRIRSEADHLGVRLDAAWPPGKVLAEIYEQRVEGTLQEPTFIVGFPKDVSPLAKDHRSIDGFTEHADLVIGGVEIAPIYSELNDPDEQRRRFEAQAEARRAGDEEATLTDEDFLEALAYGMPPAGGFGLGIDRLLTVLLGWPSLREVILFPTLRPP
ncbi:MAG: lysine--tRNA ligase [Actinomycetota bacterium]